MQDIMTLNIVGNVVPVAAIECAWSESEEIVVGYEPNDKFRPVLWYLIGDWVGVVVSALGAMTKHPVYETLVHYWIEFYDGRKWCIDVGDDRSLSYKDAKKLRKALAKLGKWKRK